VYAIINAHYEVAALLLEKGADPNLSDIAGMGALYAAVDMNSMQWVQGRPAPILHDRLDGVDLVRILLEWGADPNVQLKSHPLKRHHDAGTTLNFGQGATPLMRAARTNDVAVMQILLDFGADPFMTQPDRTDALLIAAGVGYQGLRGEGIRIVVPTEQAAIEAITLLLNQGMDIRAFNAAGNTAVHGAVHRGDSVVRFLAAHGAPVNQKNRAGFAPLDLALGAGGRGNVREVRESTAALLRTLIQEDKGSTRN
jgi:ankyrin repeat protein